MNINPVSWQAPVTPKLEGPYAPNTHLAQAEIFGAGEGIGPEDIAVDAQDCIYAPYADGRILRYDGDGKNPELFVTTGERPLGLQFDAIGNLIIDDAIKGLLSSPSGQLTHASLRLMALG